MESPPDEAGLTPDPAPPPRPPPVLAASPPPLPAATPEQPVVRSEKHSRPGIASVVLAAGAYVVLFVTVIVATVLRFQVGRPAPHSLQSLIVGLFVIGAGLIDMIALGFGISGLFEQGTKKPLAILGTVFSVLFLLLFIALLIAGMMIKLRAQAPSF